MKKLLFILAFLPSILFAGTYYIAPAGDDDTGDGSIENPWYSLTYAVSQMSAGDTLYMRGGQYDCDQSVRIGTALTGTANERTAFFGYPGERPILDYSNYDAPQLPGGNAYGSAINYSASGFLHFKNFTIQNVWQVDSFTEITAVQGQAAHNIINENINVTRIGGRAYWQETPWKWGGNPNYPDFVEPDYDTCWYINCDASWCADSLPYTTGAIGQEGNQADGFKEYGSTGERSVYYYIGCRAWRCSDDGWDTGSGVFKYIYHSISTINGYLPGGDGNGMKLAGHTDSLLNVDDPILTTVKNSITAYNNLPGYFWLEYNPYWRIQGRLWNSISYNDANAAVSTSNNELEGRETIKWQIRNCVFYADGADPEDYTWKAVSTAYQYYNEQANNFDYEEGYPGWVWTDTVAFTPSTDWAVYDSTTLVGMLTAPRNSDGSYSSTTTAAFRLVEGSDLIGAGMDIGMSETPDIGIDWAYYDANYAGEEEDDSTGTDILSFSSAYLNVPASINYTNHTVTAELVKGTKLSSHAFTWTVSPNASSDLTSGSAYDWNSPVVITVTAEDTSEQEWTVTVTVASVANTHVRGRKIKSTGKILKNNGKIIIL